MTRIRTGLVLLALAASWIAGPIVSFAQDLDPQQYVLSMHDIPPGFAVKSASDTYLSNADSADGDAQTLSELEAYGRLSGYTVTFEPEGEDLTGILSIESNTSVYETAEGARGLFDLRADSALGDWAALAVPQLGDRAIAATREVEANGSTFAFRSILMYQGRIIARVDTISLADVSFDKTVELAQAVARKLP